MNNRRRIRISKIADKMLNLGCEISLINSLSKILTEIIQEEYNLKKVDVESLSIVLTKKLINLKQQFNLVETILKI